MSRLISTSISSASQSSDNPATSTYEGIFYDLAFRVYSSSRKNARFRRANVRDIFTYSILSIIFAVFEINFNNLTVNVVGIYSEMTYAKNHPNANFRD